MVSCERFTKMTNAEILKKIEELNVLEVGNH